MKKCAILLLIFIAFSCSTPQHHPSDIRVGMTYDEVEKIMGKPDQIVRGVNQLEYVSPSSYSLSDFESIDLDSVKVALAVGDTSLWSLPKEVKTIGELLYVTWVYKESKTDTNYILIKGYRERIDSVLTTLYYVNDIPASKSEFESCSLSDYVRKQSSGKAETVGWATIADAKELIAAGYDRITKKTKKQMMLPQTRRFRSTPIKKRFLTTDFFCITFDASSGRVVISEYQPFQVFALP